MNAGGYLIGIAISLLVLLPLGIKWELDKKIVVPAALVIGLIGWSIVDLVNAAKPLPVPFSVVLHIILVVIFAGFSLLFRFYRDPERIPPRKENVILSPADGRIIYIKAISRGEIPLSEKNGKRFKLEEFVQTNLLLTEGYLIGIAMNFLDVHVNRSPIDGTIRYLKHIKGLFLSLKIKEAVFQNE